MNLYSPDDRSDLTAADRAVLADLARVLDAVEPLPEHMVDIAKAALAWRTIDAELARLVHDSAVDEPELLVRGDSERVLSFATGDVRIDVEYTGGQLVGQVSPAGEIVVELARDEGGPFVSTTTDEFGAFIIDDVAPGPLTIMCRDCGGAWRVRTQWTAL